MQAAEVIAQSKLYKSDTQQVNKYLIDLIGEDNDLMTKLNHIPQMNTKSDTFNVQVQT